MPSFEIENNFPVQKNIVGIDEVGCGPWAGPLVAVAASISRDHPPHHILEKLNDSKKLSKKFREDIYQEILREHNKTIFYGVGIIEVQEFNKLTLKNALPLCMKKALDDYPLQVNHLIIDGIRNPQLMQHTTMVKKGDSLSYTIAAASIIAKVIRDKIMEELSIKFPVYGWDNNAGYGTKKHKEAIEKFGITPFHRTCFKPIETFLKLGTF